MERSSSGGQRNWGTRIPIEYGHYNLVDDHERRVQQVSTRSDTEYVDLSVHYLDSHAPQRRQADQRINLETSSVITIATWDYAPPDQVYEFVGAGSWTILIVKDVLNAEVERHQAFIAPQDDKARLWLAGPIHGNRSGSSTPSAGRHATADEAVSDEVEERNWVLRPKPPQKLTLEAPSCPATFLDHPAAALGTDGIDLTPHVGSEWTISVSDRAIPMKGGGTWTALGSWECGPGTVRLTGSADAPGILVRARLMRVSVGARTEGDLLDAMVAAKSATRTDLRIHVEILEPNS